MTRAPAPYCPAKAGWEHFLKECQADATRRALQAEEAFARGTGEGWAQYLHGRAAAARKLEAGCAKLLASPPKLMEDGA